MRAVAEIREAAERDPLPPPPRNIEAEQQLLGSILANNAVFHRVSEYLLPEHFAEAVHRRIYAAISKLIARGETANPVTLKNLFDADGALAEIGGAAYLARLATAVATILLAPDLARTVYDLFHRREMIRVAESAIEYARNFDLDGVAADLIGEAGDQLKYHARASAGPRNLLGEWDAGEDDDPIPPREWLLGTTFCRSFLSSLLGPGGMGKTALRLAQSLSLATGRSLTGEHVFQRSRVLYVSLEDDKDELRRRAQAARLHHRVDKAEIRGWLFLSAPRGLSLAAILDGSVRVGQLGAALRATISHEKIDLVIIDPFVKSHSVPENDNAAIDAVAKQLAGIAIECGCAVDAPHHMSKGAGSPGDADKSRGASAFKDAGRLVYTLTPMTEKERDAFGISEAERHQFVRVDNAKVNLAPSADKAAWFRIVGVNLGNGTGLYPNGDNVQTVEPWEPPDLFGGLSQTLLNGILTAIDAGLPGGIPYSDQPAAQKRAAWKVVRGLAPDKTEQQARAIIRAWVLSGLLVTVDYQDAERGEAVKGLKVDDSKRPT